MFNDIMIQTHEELIRQSENKKIVLWGRNKERVFQALDKYDNIEYIVDSDCEKWGKGYNGLRVYSPSRLYIENPEDTVILVTSSPKYVFEITEQIKKINAFKIFYSHVIFDKWFNFFSVELYNNSDKIKKCLCQLNDDDSRKILAEVVKRRIMGCDSEYGDLRKTGEQQYLFPDVFRNTCDEIIIDCGAYIGDTAERFVEKFGNNIKKIYSYEVLPKNLEILNKKQAIFKSKFNWNGELTVIPYAVSNENTTLQLWETELSQGSFIPDLRDASEFKTQKAVNSFNIETRRIDDTIPKDEKVTLIKMDIEGAEYSAIQGAEEIIKRCKPRCAISIYHNASDYWRIFELLKEYVPQYKFAVRHYKNRHVDTVLYAWTEE